MAKTKITFFVNAEFHRVVWTINDILIQTITYIINKSIKEGKVPSSLKIAKVMPLHKKGDKSNPDNYRPISLLPCMSKLMERIIQLQLLNYLKANNILVPFQSGFRASHCTVTALIKVTDDWLLAMDEGMYTGVLCVDLRKVFDVVDHKELLKKLSAIGINGVALQWFKNQWRIYGDPPPPLGLPSKN